MKPVPYKEELLPGPSEQPWAAGIDFVKSVPKHVGEFSDSQSG